MEAIPGYLIDRKLSSGGTAGVYRALDIAHGHHVALKILFPKWAKEPRALELMQREAHLLKSLRHPHIVKGLSSGCWRGLNWLTMEYVAGETVLDRVHRAGPLAPKACFELARQLGEAIRYLSAHGIVHGDIKPANILLAPGGVAKLCDFGFAQLRRPGEVQEAVPFGTPAYASPEQSEGTADLDSRADLYSLGATLFHLASGRMPPPADPWGAPAALDKDFDPALKCVLARMFTPDRAERYASAEAFLADLEQLQRLRRRASRSSTLALKSRTFHWEFN